jgi:hypothetical protein
VLQSVDGIKLSTDVELLNSVVKELHGWVLLVTTEDILGLLLPG